jgi:hypothetical protein
MYRFTIVIITSLSVLGCRLPASGDLSELNEPVLSKVYFKNKAGEPYVGLPGLLSKSQGPDNPYLNFPSINDSMGRLDYSQITYTDSTGAVELMLVPSLEYVFLGSQGSPSKGHQVPYGGVNAVPIMGEDAYEVVLPEIVAEDTPRQRRGDWVDGNHNYIAVSLNLTKDTKFCSIGLGLYAAASQGMKIQIYSNDSNSPSQLLFESSTLDWISYLGKGPTDYTYGMYGWNGIQNASGLSGNLCDAAHGPKTLSAGLYWVVASLSNMTALQRSKVWVSGDYLPSATGLPMQSSADGLNWTTYEEVYYSPLDIPQKPYWVRSINVFLVE